MSHFGPIIFKMPKAAPITPEELSKYASTHVRNLCYHQFSIPKKNGGERVITAPNARLKYIQRCLAFVFSSRYKPKYCVNAFTHSRSVVDNALAHVGKNYVYNIDLKDFFTSITAKMVATELCNLGFDPDMSQLLSKICTYPVTVNGKTQNMLPQGAPSSPILSNICARRLDNRLIGLACRFNLNYSRYADDITFSSNHNVYSPGGEFITELYSIINHEHMQVNEKKCRLQKRGSRQEVTGLIVNEKVNVSRKYYKNLRALIHQIACSELIDPNLVRTAQGKLNYLSMVTGYTNQRINLRRNLYYALVKHMWFSNGRLCHLG
ncbi:MAG: reverse transcriptase domain-containing protein [Muribaculaceae bacterium]